MVVSELVFGWGMSMPLNSEALTSPIQTLSRVTTSIIRSIEAVGKQAHAYYSRQDDEAFVLAFHPSQFNMLDFADSIGILKKEGRVHFCIYEPELKYPEVKVNTLNTLVLANYMLDWFKAVGGEIFPLPRRLCSFLARLTKNSDRDCTHQMTWYPRCRY